MVWAKFTPQLPWWPALLADAPTPRLGATVAVRVLGSTDVLRVPRRFVDRDFVGKLADRSRPWNRRKCAGMKTAFRRALAHARLLLAPRVYAACPSCANFIAVAVHHSESGKRAWIASM